MNTYTFFNVKEYFDPIPKIDRWLNPFEQLVSDEIDQNPISIFVTKRALEQLNKQRNAIYIEMQLMYSCVLKKRTIFHRHPGFEFQSLGDNINVCFRSVQAASCAPEEFAKHYPEKREFEPKRFPKKLFVDYKNKSWEGCFEL